MQNFALNIIILDDESIIRKELRQFLERNNNYRIFEAAKPSELFKIIEENEIDIIISDINLPEIDGLTLLNKIKVSYPDLPVIIITGFGDNDTILSALRAGAFDFFHKPLRLNEIQNAIKRTDRYAQLLQKLKKKTADFELLFENAISNDFNEFICVSKKLKEVLQLSLTAASTKDTAILITGESGVGKEVIAKIIHISSARKHNIFYPVNCSAIPENLFESEFFGYTKGAFSGAHTSKKGILKSINSGTLFLDEICELPLNFQPKLLRILEDKTVISLGDTISEKIDFRLISATNRNLNQMIDNCMFRLDLYHRINTIEINIPPLRERIEDIKPLIDYFIDFFNKKMNKKIIGCDKEVYKILEDYHFPGNVRELKNLIERAMILSQQKFLTTNLFNLPIKKNNYFSNYANTNINIKPQINNSENQNNNKQTIQPLYELEKQMIINALEECSNNKTKAAQLLGISRFVLLRKLKKYKISIDSNDNKKI